MSDLMKWCFAHTAPFESYLDDILEQDDESYCSMALLWEYAGVDHGPPCRLGWVTQPFEVTWRENA